MHSFFSAILHSLGSGSWPHIVREAAVATAVFLAVFIGFLWMRRLTLRRLRAVVRGEFSQHLYELLADLFTRVGNFEYALVAFYIAVRPLNLNAEFDNILRIVLVAVLSFRAALIIQEALAYFLRKTPMFASEDSNTKAVFQNVRLMLNGAVWVGIVAFILENMGVNITTAVAGLGIGGVAIALAAQQILGDLFSSFVIFVDKPFKVGDFIVVDNLMGTVEHVGIKTTRLRSLSGELLVMANSDLTKSRLHNYQQMTQRRVVFGFGVTYQTSYEKMRAIPGMIREIVCAVEKTRLDRVNFKNFGDSSLNFEVVYYVLSPDYSVYMNVQESINLAMLDLFAKEKIDFAYPTQTVFLAR